MVPARPVLLALSLVLAADAYGEDAGGAFFAFGRIPDSLPAGQTIEMTVEECVLAALKANYDVTFRRLAVDAAGADVLSERGAFEPALFAEGGRTTSTGLDTNGVEETTADRGEAGIRTRLISGTEVSLAATYAESSEETNGTGSVGVSLTQPLLRGAGFKTVRAPLVIARRNRAISVQDLAGQMIDTAVSVQNAYWDLVSARESLVVQEESLKFARELSDLTRQRADAGLMAESDTVEAEAAVYAREADVAGAGEYLRRVEDSLKEQLALFEDPSFWSAAIRPVSDPVLPEIDVDFLPALREALASRPDYQSELLRLKNADLSLYTAKNGLLPRLDLVASGERSDSADGPGQAFDAASNSDEEIWSLFLRLEIPLGSKSERADYRRSRIAREQQLLRMKQLELRIIREVRGAVDALATSRMIVEVTARAVELEQKKLDNERAKLELGKSSTDNVVRFIQSLNGGRLRHVEALLGFKRDLVRLEQVKGTTLQTYGVAIETYE